MMKRRGKRINWTPIALTCLGLGAATGGLALALTKSADPTPATARSRAFGESLRRTSESIDKGNLVSAELRNRPRTGIVSAGGAQSIAEEMGPEVGQNSAAPDMYSAPRGRDPATVAESDRDGGAVSDIRPPVTDAAVTALPTDAGAPQDPAEAPLGADAGSTLASADELPAGAEQGLTYCGHRTCNVGFKCCCDQCTAFDEPCYSPQCDVYTGLSVSAACGMDICDPGEVCCDSSCGACSESGVCPEQACD